MLRKISIADICHHTPFSLVSQYHMCSSQHLLPLPGVQQGGEGLPLQEQVLWPTTYRGRLQGHTSSLPSQWTRTSS